MADAAKLQAVYDAIKNEPERWHQGTFIGGGPQICDSTLCIAGWSVILDNPDIKTLDQFHDFVQDDEAGVAARILDLTYDQAQFLFYDFQGQFFPDELIDMDRFWKDKSYWEPIDQFGDQHNDRAYTLEALRRAIKVSTGVEVAP